MNEIFNALSVLDLVALLLFVFSWLFFEVVTDFSRVSPATLSGLMAERRKHWMLAMANRELRMIDTQILAGLQQGAAFFASTSILAIGGCFALLGSTDLVLQIYRDLPLTESFNRIIWEIKVLGLTSLFAYTFFKFGWAYRLFNYCSIMIGTLPNVTDSLPGERKKLAQQAGNMNIIAGRHFSSGLRGIFFAIGYMGWFIGPKMFLCTTIFTLMVLTRRQYFSQARKVLMDQSIISTPGENDSQ